MAAAAERLVNAKSRTVHIAVIEETLLLGNTPHLSKTPFVYAVSPFGPTIK
jgi:hypothetical protein